MNSTQKSKAQFLWESLRAALKAGIPGFKEQIAILHNLTGWIFKSVRIPVDTEFTRQNFNVGKKQLNFVLVVVAELAAAKKVEKVS